MPQTVFKMDKDFLISFILSFITFIGIGIGFIMLLLFFTRNLSYINLVVSIAMIVAGLFALVGLLMSER